MQISAVAFDFDGTLYPYNRMLLHSIPLGMRHPRFISQFSAMRREIRDIRPIPDFHGFQAELMAARLGIPAARALELINRIIYDKWMGCFQGIHPFPGVETCLHRLKADGMKIALLSDFPVETRLRGIGLDRIPWDCAFTSEESGYLKPNPEPFLLLARRLDLDPGRILYVGDTFRYDIRGARSVGMKTALIDYRSKSKEQALFNFRNYAEFPDRLNSLMRE